MTKTIINPDTLARPSGYANGILTEGGRLLFLAGQTGMDASGAIVTSPPELLPQFKQALTNLRAVVTAAGGDMSNIVKMTIYVTSLAEYKNNLKAVGDIHRSFFGRYYPAMALVEVKSLWDADAMIEIEALAVIGA
jgi:enamine deaminase RidA (YjgF/YER057c/UK114 family)